MTRSVFALTGDRLRWLEGSSGDERRLGEKDAEALQDYAERYRLAAKKLKPWDDLLVLGRELYGWLNGEEGWLDSAQLTGIESPWFLEIRVPAEPGALGAALLEAPWEVLTSTNAAQGEVPLAARGDRVLSPVRRLGAPGEPLTPKDTWLRMVFMAAQPDGVSSLAYEDEENGILDATAELGLELLVDDSGEIEQLERLLGATEGVDVVHLSCHGSSEPEPVLLTEDAYGAAVFTKASDLHRALRLRRPPLVMLSACETAAADHVLGSLAATLVRLGQPTLLGWGGSVKDVEATRFAEHLYRELAQGATVEQAVAWARHDLLSAENREHSRDWHQARLFVSPRGGGQLVRRGAGRNREGAALGHRFLALLDAAEVQPASGVLVQAARLCVTVGDPQEAHKLFTRARKSLAALEAAGVEIDLLESTWSLVSHARLLVSDGEIEGAFEVFQQVEQRLSLAGRERERAVTLGDIARIHDSRGEVDQALVLHEEARSVFESLGASRERAVTLGDIARIHSSRGDVDQALALHLESLQLAESLLDREGVANARWCIGQIEIVRQQWESAASNLTEAYSIMLEIGRLDGICFVGLDLGQLLCGGGRVDEGRAILLRSLEGFRKLGRDTLVQEIEEILSQLPAPDDSSA